MKDFEKILEEVLTEREEKQKEKDGLEDAIVEEIIECVLKEFKNPTIGRVRIEKVWILDHDEIWIKPVAVEPVEVEPATVKFVRAESVEVEPVEAEPVDGGEVKPSFLMSADVVYNRLKKILYSGDDKRTKTLKDKLIINVLDNEKAIQFELK